MDRYHRSRLASVSRDISACSASSRYSLTIASCAGIDLCGRRRVRVGHRARPSRTLIAAMTRAAAGFSRCPTAAHSRPARRACLDSGVGRPRLQECSTRCRASARAGTAAALAARADTTSGHRVHCWSCYLVRCGAVLYRNRLLLGVVRRGVLPPCVRQGWPTPEPSIRHGSRNRVARVASSTA